MAAGSFSDTSDISDIDHPWLRGMYFDLSFIAGLATVAIISGIIVALKPESFLLVLTLDLWLLGYHHVAATYTRLTFDSESWREHKNKVIYLPIIVAIAVTSMVLLIGPWLIATIYLHWQWYHYTRQSEGVSKAYAGRSGNFQLSANPCNRIIFYLVPFAGIVNLSAKAPEQFLFMPVATLPISPMFLLTVNALACAGFAWWMIVNLKKLQQGKSSFPWFLYMMSHFAIFTIAYIAFDNINFGWLVVNIWHNAQYILFVWHFNNKRFNGKVDTKHLLISTLSKNNNISIYLGATLALSSATYFIIDLYGVDAVSSVFGVSTIAAAMIVYQTINFHHYIVDASIWKMRKSSVRTNLDIK
ncbi:hypothetical protein AB833_10575 [Chromatiales bacterium (ex Bugula neritina AB1)]|nr:hypothetical protein AB833_10575 [Chromatiales bacterium (ex Bugula neritina AB1)]